MNPDPETTYHRDNDGVLRPVASGIVWSPVFESAPNRTNAAIARRIAVCSAVSREAWQAGELERMLRANRRARRLRRELLARLPDCCNPYLKGRAA